MVSRTFFNKWARKMSNRARREPNIYITPLNDRKGIVLVNLKNGNTAMSKCHPDDRQGNYNIDIGIAIAYARLTGQNVPKIDNRVPMSSLNAGIKFYYNKIECCYSGFHTKDGKCICVAGLNSIPWVILLKQFELVKPIKE